MKEIIIHLTMTYYAEIISITPGIWYRKRSTIMMLVTSMNREELRMKMMSRVMITMMITMLTLGSRKSNNLAMILLKRKQILHIASEHQMTMVTIDFTDQQVNENNLMNEYRWVCCEYGLQGHDECCIWDIIALFFKKCVIHVYVKVKYAPALWLKRHFSWKGHIW